MGWAIVSLLGFVLMTGAVAAMARSNTARWERDHRAARALVRRRQEAALRVRAAALVAQHAPPRTHRLPHPHVPRLRLPPWVADRLPHPHLPHPHLPHPHLPPLDGRLARRLVRARRGDPDRAAEGESSPTGSAAP